MCSRDGRYSQDVSEWKRKSRNLSEKKRRDAFNSLVTELALLVTGVDRRLDKSNVLKQTIAFLRKNNLLQGECTNSDTIDQSIPPYLSSSEYFHLFMDTLESFLFIVDVGTDSENAIISYVSENAARHGPAVIEQLRGKSLYDVLLPDYEAFVRETFRSKLLTSMSIETMEHSGVVSSTGFFGFNCLIRPSSMDHCGDGDQVELEIAVKARFKTLNGSLVCLCLGMPVRHGLSILCHYSSQRLDAPTSGFEFTTRVSAEWKFIHVDHCATQVVGYQPIELLGSSWYDFCHPDDLDLLARSHEQLKTTTDGMTAPYRFRTKSEEYIWIRTRFYVTYHEWNSKLEFITCTHNTITDEKLQEPFVNKTDPVHASSLKISLNSSTQERRRSIEGSDVGTINIQNRQIFRPQPGVRIEHTPISTSASRPPPAKKSRDETVVSETGFPEEITAQSIGQMDERVLWEVLEKRQTNLQQKINQHQQELRRLQEQLLTAMPLLASSPAGSSSNGTSEMISPASSTLSPASGSLLSSTGSLSTSGNGWIQQRLNQNYANHGWTHF